MYITDFTLEDIDVEKLKDSYKETGKLVHE